MSNQAIGIFDSGIGGTSIWKEIHSATCCANLLTAILRTYCYFQRKQQQQQQQQIVV